MRGATTNVGRQAEAIYAVARKRLAGLPRGVEPQGRVGLGRGFDDGGPVAE